MKTVRFKYITPVLKIDDNNFDVTDTFQTFYEALKANSDDFKSPIEYQIDDKIIKTHEFKFIIENEKYPLVIGLASFSQNSTASTISRKHNECELATTSLPYDKEFVDGEGYILINANEMILCGYGLNHEDFKKFIKKVVADFYSLKGDEFRALNLELARKKTSDLDQVKCMGLQEGIDYIEVDISDHLLGHNNVKEFRENKGFIDLIRQTIFEETTDDMKRDSGDISVKITYKLKGKTRADKRAKTITRLLFLSIINDEKVHSNVKIKTCKGHELYIDSISIYKDISVKTIGNCGRLDYKSVEESLLTFLAEVNGRKAA